MVADDYEADELKEIKLLMLDAAYPRNQAIELIKNQGG